MMYDEEESECERNTLVSHSNPPRKDQLMDFFGNLLILDDLMTMTTNYRKSIDDLQISKDEAEARRVQHLSLLLSMNNREVDS